MTSSLWDGLSNHIGEKRTTGHRRTTGLSVSSVIWAAVQPGRNHGKGPGKRWVYCLNILLDVTDAYCLALFFFFFLHMIFWEHPLRASHVVWHYWTDRVKWDYCVNICHIKYTLWRSYPNLFIYPFNVSAVCLFAILYIPFLLKLFKVIVRIVNLCIWLWQLPHEYLN